MAVTRAREESRIYSDRQSLAVLAEDGPSAELPALARAFGRDRPQVAAVTGLDPTLGLARDQLTEHQRDRWTAELQAAVELERLDELTVAREAQLEVSRHAQESQAMMAEMQPQSAFGRAA